VIAGRNPENVRRDVQAALQLADVVIVSLHDGIEYTQRVAQGTQEFSRAAIDAGAIAVLGHHPHVPQRVEPYKHGWIFYSLGNFVFQQNTPPAVKHALMARLTFAGTSLAQVEILPAIIETFAKPRLATPEEAARMLKSIGIESAVLWRREAVAPEVKGVEEAQKTPLSASRPASPFHPFSSSLPL
jgi:poly-gamma-glutamate synthesis protein (capsule biosynthesis protein)